MVPRGFKRSLTARAFSPLPSACLFVHGQCTLVFYLSVFSLIVFVLMANGQSLNIQPQFSSSSECPCVVFDTTCVEDGVCALMEQGPGFKLHQLSPRVHGLSCHVNQPV